MNKIKTIKGWDFFCLALYAFGGLGLEAIMAFIIEPLLYGSQMNKWLIWQNISHWIMTCILWGIVSVFLIKLSKTKYDFDIFEKATPMKNWQYIVTVICVIFMLVVSYFDWNGFKVIKEYNANGLLKFIFQYIYYVFETVLFMLIIVFGQKAFEKWFKNETIPYGGIVVALTWGLAHIFTKGDITVGVLSALGGFIFGVVYLLVNRDIKKTFFLLFIMFVF